MPASKCPACGGRTTYVGFQSVECVTETCKHWDGTSRVPFAPGLDLWSLPDLQNLRKNLPYPPAPVWIPPAGFNTTTHPAILSAPPAVGDVYTRANSQHDWTITSIDPQYVTLQSGGMMITLPMSAFTAPAWTRKPVTVSTMWTGAGQIASVTP